MRNKRLFVLASVGAVVAGLLGVSQSARLTASERSPTRGFQSNNDGVRGTSSPIVEAVSEPVETLQFRNVQFDQARTVAQAQGSARVIVEFDVPNFLGFAAASRTAKGPQAAAQADARLAGAIGPIQRAELAKLGGTVHAINRTYSTIPFAALTVSVDALNRLQASPNVLSITEDRADPAVLDNTVNIVGASAAWAQGYDGSGVYVAILDTGIRPTHDFFVGKTIVQACFSLGEDGLGPVGDCPNGLTTDTTSANAARHLPLDGVFHGTHVSGIAAGNDPTRVPPLYGVARGADIIAVQVFSWFTATGDPRSYVSDQIAGLEYVYSIRGTHNISSINMSLGGAAVTDQAACDSANAAEKIAIDNLRAAGIATVIASGNGGSCTGIAGPGCISSAIAVGNTSDGDVEASDSNFHTTMLDLYAPGSSVLSSVGNSDGSYTSYSGTSMSTPHVVGAYAIIKQAVPSADVSTVLAALQATGDPVSGRCTATPTQRRIQIDLALEMLLAGHPKFRQLPNNAGESIHSDVDLTDTNPNAVLADDFVSDGRPTHTVRWWGSNLSTGTTASASASASAPPSGSSRRVPGSGKASPSVPAHTEAEVQAMVAEKARLAASSPAIAAAPPDQAQAGGDTCATATVIASLPFSDTGNSCTGNNDYEPGITGASCPFSGGTADDLVYSYAPGSNVDVEITLCGNTAYDSKVYVYENVCGGGTPDNRCNDDTCFTPSFPSFAFVSRLPSVSMTAGNTYFIIVDGFGTDCGNYTLDVLPIVCGDGIVAGPEECDPPDGTTCNAICQLIVCGDGIVEGLETCDPPNGITCDNMCQSIPNPPIDGWLVSFHEPLAKGGSPAEPLGLYFCDAAVVDVSATAFGSCDLRSVREYFVRLDECCLLVANVDSRSSNTPAQIDGFHDEQCVSYDIDIQAVMGVAYSASGGSPGVCDTQVSTGNTATIPFWAWHTAPTDSGGRWALSSTVTPPGADWLYGPWVNITPTCAQPHMAFELLTDDDGGEDCNNNGTPDVCESGPDCQPNGVFDECDIAAGTSQDCQPNTIPDECDIIGGAADCQPDGIPDLCQLAGNDDNGNNVPDECDPTVPGAGSAPDKNRAISVQVAPPAGPAILVDDGVAENAIGVGGNAFGWANRFTNTSGGPLQIVAVDVAFGYPAGAGGVSPGDRVDGVIWVDATASGNMLNATKLVQWVIPGGVHSNLGTFATHSIPGGVTIPTGADYYVGMGDIQSSIDSLPRFPAAIDETPPSAVRSWAFFHPTLNVFDPDNLAGQTIGTIDGFGFPGNWLLRARLAAPTGPTTAMRVMVVDLQHPNPRNQPGFPPSNFTAWDTVSDNVCSGGQFANHHCHTDADCTGTPNGTCPAGIGCTEPVSGAQGGCARWAGPVQSVLHWQAFPARGGYKVSRLQCTPYYHDWSADGEFHIIGAEVMPSSTYTVQSVALTCAGTEDICTNVSPFLTRTTARYGDVATLFNPPSATTQPDGLDVTNLVAHFRVSSTAISKVLAQLQPNVLEANGDISGLDITLGVNAFRFRAYQESGPCACPSTVPCDTTLCVTGTDCIGSYGPGSTCIKTCVGGVNAGVPCAANTHCEDLVPGPSPGDGTCGSGFCRDRCGRCN